VDGTEVTDGPGDSELWVAVSGEGWELCCRVDVTYTRVEKRYTLYFLAGKTEQVHEAL